MDPNDFHYMDTNSFQKIKKVIQVELVPAPPQQIIFILLLSILLIYLAIMYLNNTKHENDLTKDHDTREIKSYSIIKWPIKNMRVKNGLIYI